MGRHDWYQQKEWSPEIEIAFFKQLKRARNGKPQYLRVQASNLTETYPDVSLRLLNLYFEYDDHFDLALGYAHAARAYLALDRIEDAISSYEAALKREEAYPRMGSRAWIELPYLIATKKVRARFDDALKLLDAKRNKVVFPIDHYYWNASMALILSAYKSIKEARQFAVAAIDAAKKENSGFRYHPDVGLFSDNLVNEPAHREVKRIARQLSGFMGWFSI